MQRLRVTFGRGEATKFITHLDMMRYWERAFRRARIPIAFSQGFHPHPRFSLAAPLPVGVTGEGELMDIFLEGWMAPDMVHAALAAEMVPGVEVLSVKAVDPSAPSLQSLMRYAEYRVVVESSRPKADVETAIARLLALPELPWEHLRDGELRRYDLRAQIDALWCAACQEGAVELGMRLKTDSQAAGRPEQVAKALGFEAHPRAIHRTRLILGTAEERGSPSGRRRAGVR